MGLRIYTLSADKVPVPVENFHEWVSWLASHRGLCRVAYDHIDGIEVSTIFLGLDHGHFGGEPVLFETMIFGGKYDQCKRKWSTWAEAEAGHAEAVAIVKGTAGEESSMKMKFYILDENKNVVPVESLTAFLEWANKHPDLYRVANDEACGGRIETVFLGADRRDDSGETSLFFETWVFGGKLNGQRRRWATWAEAEAGHAQMLAKVKEAGDEQ